MFLCFVQKLKNSVFFLVQYWLTVSVTCKERVYGGIKLNLTLRWPWHCSQSGSNSRRNGTCFCFAATRVFAVFRLLSSKDNISVVCIVRIDWKMCEKETQLFVVLIKLAPKFRRIGSMIGFTINCTLKRKTWPQFRSTDRRCNFDTAQKAKHRISRSNCMAS